MNQSANMLAQEQPLVNTMSAADREIANYKKIQMTLEAEQKQKDAMSIIASVIGQKFAGMGLDKATSDNMVLEYLKKMFGENAGMLQTGQLTTGQEIPNLTPSLFAKDNMSNSLFNVNP
jgi:hypothetical protein